LYSKLRDKSLIVEFKRYMRNKAKPVDLLKFDKEIFDSENKPSTSSEKIKRKKKTKKFQSNKLCLNKRLNAQITGSVLGTAEETVTPASPPFTTKPQESYSLYLNDNRDKFWSEDTMSRISTSSLNDPNLLLNSCDGNLGNCSMATSSTTNNMNIHLTESSNSILIKNKDVQWALPVVESDNESLK
jgi:hypothetical protein